MTCPVCGSTHIRVIETISTDSENIFRVRICQNCRKRFYTKEIDCTKKELAFYWNEKNRIYKEKRERKA